MAIDYAEKEREFLSGLAADTGRDLAGWMAAIRETNLTDRNDIIDWLRRQGFLFAKASWLERIHHNGGRPIYLDPAEVGAPGAGSLPERTPPQPIPFSPPPAVIVQPDPVQPAPILPAPPPVVAQDGPDTSGTATIESLLAEAKAYRPLAQFVLREIEKALGDVQFSPRNGYVSLNRGIEFGILTIAPKELRLALAFGQSAAPAPFVKARFPKSHPDLPPTMSHMVVLTDARQVTADLVATVRDVAMAAT